MLKTTTKYALGIERVASIRDAWCRTPLAIRDRHQRHWPIPAKWFLGVICLFSLSSQPKPTSIKSTVIWSSNTTWRTATTHFCTNCITRLRHVNMYSRSSGVGELSSTQLWNKCANSSISTGTGMKTMCVSRKSSKNGSLGPTCPPNLVSSKCSSIFCGVPDITVYLSNAGQMEKIEMNRRICRIPYRMGFGWMCQGWGHAATLSTIYNHNSCSPRSAKQCAAAFYLWFQRERNSKWNLHSKRGRLMGIFLHFNFSEYLARVPLLLLCFPLFAIQRNSNWIFEINIYFLFPFRPGVRVQHLA